MSVAKADPAIIVGMARGGRAIDGTPIGGPAIGLLGGAMDCCGGDCDNGCDAG